jgi:hypothetical protein
MLHWIAYVLGLTNASGGWYLWWSGFFGDVTIFAGLFALYFKHNCHVRGCWRVAKHVVDGSPYCSRHHPGLQ